MGHTSDAAKVLVSKTNAIHEKARRIADLADLIETIEKLDGGGRKPIRALTLCNGVALDLRNVPDKPETASKMKALSDAAGALMVAVMGDLHREIQEEKEQL